MRLRFAAMLLMACLCLPGIAAKALPIEKPEVTISMGSWGII